MPSLSDHAITTRNGTLSIQASEIPAPVDEQRGRSKLSLNRKRRRGCQPCLTGPGESARKTKPSCSANVMEHVRNRTQRRTRGDESGCSAVPECDGMLDTLQGDMVDSDNDNGEDDGVTGHSLETDSQGNDRDGGNSEAKSVHNTEEKVENCKECRRNCDSTVDNESEEWSRIPIPSFTPVDDALHDNDSRGTLLEGEDGKSICGNLANDERIGGATIHENVSGFALDESKTLSNNCSTQRKEQEGERNISEIISATDNITTTFNNASPFDNDSKSDNRPDDKLNSTTSRVGGDDDSDDDIPSPAFFARVLGTVNEKLNCEPISNFDVDINLLKQRVDEHSIQCVSEHLNVFNHLEKASLNPVTNILANNDNFEVQVVAKENQEPLTTQRSLSLNPGTASVFENLGLHNSCDDIQSNAANTHSKHTTRRKAKALHSKKKIRKGKESSNAIETKPNRPSRMHNRRNQQISPEEGEFDVSRSKALADAEEKLKLDRKNGFDTAGFPPKRRTRANAKSACTASSVSHLLSGGNCTSCLACSCRIASVAEVGVLADKAKSKLSSCDGEIERALLSRLSRLEKNIAWFENLRYKVEKDLRKHRSAFIKRDNARMEAIAKETKNGKSRFLPDLSYEQEDRYNVGDPAKKNDSNVLHRGNASRARSALFSFSANYQPTLTQMCFEVNTSVDTKESDDIEQTENVVAHDISKCGSNADEGNYKVSTGSLELAENSNVALSADMSNNSMPVDDTEKNQLQEITGVIPTPVQSNYLFVNSMPIDESNVGEGGTIHYREGDNENCDGSGTHHKFELDISPRRSGPQLWSSTSCALNCLPEVGCIELSAIEQPLAMADHGGIHTLLEFLNVSSACVKENLDNDEEKKDDYQEDLQQLSPRGAKAAQQLEDEVTANPTTLQMIESACPNWRHDLKYAQQRTDVAGIEEALVGIDNAIKLLEQDKVHLEEMCNAKHEVLRLYRDALKCALQRLSILQD